MEYTLSDAGRAALRQEIECVAEAVTNVFLAGARLGPRIFLLDPATPGGGTYNPEADWRSAILARYEAGTWKHTVVEFMPFGRFRPAAINAHADEIARRHPRHRHPTSGVTNTLAELLRDGTIVKVGRGLYAPALNGVALC